MDAIGRPLPRAGGRLKVTGTAHYTVDVSPAGALHAAIVHSTIANGRVPAIDTVAAANATVRVASR
jgi:xanthine dehydrogenase YagR molybdenum-binding subunit